MDIFELIFNEEDEELMGIVAMGFVDAPAIESGVLRFSKEIEVKSFKADEKKMQITGPYMIPDKKMLRADADGKTYEVFYTAGTIEKLSNWMMKTNNFNKTNVMHNQEDFNDASENYMLEHWIKTSDVDKSVELGLDVPIGSAIMTYQLDAETFAKFDNGELNGLSIELAMSDKNYKKTDMNENRFKKLYETISEFFKVNEELFEEEVVEEVTEEVVEEAVEETAEEVTEEITEDAPVTEEVVEEVTEIEEVTEEVTEDVNIAESIAKMTEMLEALTAKVELLETTNVDLKKKLTKKPVAKPVEAVEAPKKAFTDMTKAEQISANLKKYKKRHNL